MRFTIALSIFLAASFTQTAALSCDSQCAACWKDGAPGVDTKFWCDVNSDTSCGSDCPSGYSDIHCADADRCICDVGGDCSALGPCLCGIGYTSDGSYEECNTASSGTINC